MQRVEIRSHLAPQRRPGARRPPPAEARSARPEDPEDPRSGPARRVPSCPGLAGGNIITNSIACLHRIRFRKNCTGTIWLWPFYKKNFSSKKKCFSPPSPLTHLLHRLYPQTYLLALWGGQEQKKTLETILVRLDRKGPPWTHILRRLLRL